LYFGLAAGAFIGIGLFLTYIQPGYLTTDGGIFSAIALKDYNNGTLYVNAWENKPPALFYLLELFFLFIPNKIYAVFILGFVAFMVISIGLTYLIFKRLESLIATLVFTFIALYFTVFKNNIGDGLFTEIYGTACVIIGLVLIDLYLQYKKLVLLFGSAILIGLSFWFKETFILFVVPIFIFYYNQFKANGKILLTVFALTIPSLFFIGLLAIQGELYGFIDLIRYNLKYISSENPISIKVKLNDLNTNLLYHIRYLIFLVLYMIYKVYQQKEGRKSLLYILGLFLASFVLVYLSPYNFGHYYFSCFVFVFLCISMVYKLYSEKINKQFKWLFIILCLIIMYNMDQALHPKFTYKIEPYKADRISQYLSEKKDKTLFVDYVVRSDYYIKSGLIYPTYLPVALPVHFGEDAMGIQNRAKIWQNLSNNKPDYLITTYTTSYFSWFLPETGFYNENFTKIDSLQAQNDDIIYLWALKNAKL
jgi:hypothetical protein